MTINITTQIKEFMFWSKRAIEPLKPIQKSVEEKILFEGINFYVANHTLNFVELLRHSKMRLNIKFN